MIVFISLFIVLLILKKNYLDVIDLFFVYYLFAQGSYTLYILIYFVD